MINDIFASGTVKTIIVCHGYKGNNIFSGKSISINETCEAHPYGRTFKCIHLKLSFIYLTFIIILT